ncbi:uncharacterized protein [Diabrotica undecimpunctata]|uniref:uncharacterized protein isoform X2 n=1 Tax=Diabrotica undecimpunctata TaxID=50387 RepID=UPI003B63539D
MGSNRNHCPAEKTSIYNKIRTNLDDCPAELSCVYKMRANSDDCPVASICIKRKLGYTENIAQPDGAIQKQSVHTKSVQNSTGPLQNNMQVSNHDNNQYNTYGSQKKNDFNFSLNNVDQSRDEPNFSYQNPDKKLLSQPEEAFYEINQADYHDEKYNYNQQNKHELNFDNNNGTFDEKMLNREQQDQNILKQPATNLYENGQYYEEKVYQEYSDVEAYERNLNENPKENFAGNTDYSTPLKKRTQNYGSIQKDKKISKPVIEEQLPLPVCEEESSISSETSCNCDILKKDQAAMENIPLENEDAFWNSLVSFMYESSKIMKKYESSFQDSPQTLGQLSSKEKDAKLKQLLHRIEKKEQEIKQIHEEFRELMPLKKLAHSPAVYKHETSKQKVFLKDRTLYESSAISNNTDRIRQNRCSPHCSNICNKPQKSRMAYSYY